MKQPARSCPQRQVQAYDLQGREGRVGVGRVAPRSSDPQERLGESHAEEQTACGVDKEHDLLSSVAARAY